MTGNLNQNQNPNRQMPMRPPVAQDTSLTPKEILSILRRHLLMIIVFTFMGTIAGGGLWFVMKTLSPKYTAQTAIEVLHPGQSDPMEFDSLTPNKDINYQFRFTKASYMKQNSFLQNLLKIDAIRNTKWYAQFDNDIADAVDSLDKNLGISPQRDSEWIVVSMTCQDAEESALIANEAVTSFLKKQDVLAKKDTSEQLGQLEQQRQKIEGELKSLEDSLTNMRRGTDYANLEPTTFRSYLDETLSDTQNNRNAIESQIAELQANIDLLSARIEGEYDDTVREQIERDSTAIAIRNRITLLEQELASQRAHFGERHRQVIELRDAIDQLYKDLDNRKIMIGDIVRRSRLIGVEDQMVASSKMLETLETQRQRAQEHYRSLSILKAEYARIMKLRDEKQNTLEKINTHLEKLKVVHDNPDLSKVKRAFMATVPLQMSSPKIIIFVPGGFMLGAMLGFAIAFLVELANELLRSPSDVAKHLRSPLLAAICHSKEDAEMKNVDLYHAVRQAPFSITSESYRQLRTNLKHSNSAINSKVLFVTSPSIGGGKSTVALNLAETLAAEGLNVLFIDTHFRNPVSYAAFPDTNDTGSVIDTNGKGLSNYLLGQYELEEIIRDSAVQGLKLIDCGPMPANSAEILSNARMSNLLENCAHNFDYVILDGPGLLVNSAKILAAQAQGTMLVCNVASTKRGEAKRTLRELHEINANVIGVVLVGVKSMKGGYFHERYKTYRKYQKMRVPASV